MRTIRSRNDREYVKWHHPIGTSATKRGASLTVEELVKKTSVLERQKMIEDSPLYDEFKAGTPIESLDLLEYIDLGIQPLDLTDAEMLRNIARQQIAEQYDKWKKLSQSKVDASQVPDEVK